MAFTHRPTLSNTSRSSIADYKSYTRSSSSSNDANKRIKELDVSQTTHLSYVVRFYDDRIYTVVTHTALVVDEWISNIYTDFGNKLDNLVVGLDCEWTLNYEKQKGSSTRQSRNKVAIVQLCVAHRCLIFQFAWRDSIPASLYEFLNNEKFRFVGVAVAEDGNKLYTDYKLKVAKTIDLQPLAAAKLERTELGRAGLKSLAKTVLAQDLPKPKNVTLSKWDAISLTDRQIEYACLDAFVSCKLGTILLHGFEGSLENLFSYHRH